MNILFISGSFPYKKDGIGDSAEKLYAEFLKLSKCRLITTKCSEIEQFVTEKSYEYVNYFNSWGLKLSNFKKIIKIIRDYNIEKIHIEYPGKAYEKGLFIIFLPLYMRIYNIFNRKRHINIYVRLHEYSKSKFIRKLVIIILVLFSEKIYTPGYDNYKILSTRFGHKIKKCYIGNNIHVIRNKVVKKDKIINLAYFGFVYPYKGIEKLLYIFQQIKKKDKDNTFKFTIIGEINTDENNHFKNYHSKVIRMMQDMGLYDCVRITGFLTEKDVSKEIEKADIAILPFEDGLSLRRGSFLAFLAHGKPIVTTEGDFECTNIFRNEEGVYMSDDVNSMIKIIIKWASSRKNMELIGKRNADISRMLEWNKIAEDMIKDY